MLGLLNKLGTDLLSHLFGSTIGPGGLNFSVRNGKRWNPAGIGTLDSYGSKTNIFRHVDLRRSKALGEEVFG